jgi:hypothetical protein
MNHDEKFEFKFVCCAAPQNLRRESEEVLVRLDPVKFLVRLLELLALRLKPPIFGGGD